MTEVDVAALNLDVYDTKQGLWNPDHGSLEQPAGWEVLPSGDAFVTRRVKAAGIFWVLWRPRGRNREHRRKLGLLAPKTAIDAARADAVQTSEQRERQRQSNARYRVKVEDAYRADLTAAVMAWLDFRPEHAQLAEQIAVKSADRAAEVGSGRVGRTKLLPLEERAALAARATIRHEYTDYDDRLAELDPFDDIDDFEYRLAKSSAHDAVDEFLAAHRRPEQDSDRNA